VPLNEIAGYTIIRQLGAGGMGQVFLVQHPRLPRHDALKLVDSGVSRNNDFKARFKREADLLAQLSHPNIVTLFDRGDFEGQLWITMEFVDGTDCAQLLETRGPLPMPLVLTLIGATGSALDYAWRKQRITHRDVKPANILVAFDDVDVESVKLADFGIAKAASESTSLTSTGITVGTMSYTSPEAIEGADIDNRADLYSLGCTAYHLLTGAPPFSGNSITALMSAHLTRTPPLIADQVPHLPTSLNQVFTKVLAKDPDQRFQTSAEFVVALRTAVGNIDQTDSAGATTVVAAPAPTVVRKVGKGHRASKVRTAAAGSRLKWAVALVMVIGLGGLGVVAVAGDWGKTRGPSTEEHLPPPSSTQSATPRPVRITTTARTSDSPSVLPPLAPTEPPPATVQPAPPQTYTYEPPPTSAVTLARKLDPCTTPGATARDIDTRQPLKCATNDYYPSPVWLATG
jgi:serine/threonine protein kinase